VFIRIFYPASGTRPTVASQNAGFQVSTVSKCQRECVEHPTLGADGRYAEAVDERFSGTRPVIDGRSRDETGGRVPRWVQNARFRVSECQRECVENLALGADGRDTEAVERAGEETWPVKHD
jgi:hypothetical protein